MLKPPWLFEVPRRYRPIPPKPLDLASPAGRALVMETAKKVMTEHREVLEALARR